MWEDLQKRYGVANAPKVYQLKANLAERRQGGMTVVEFYSKLRGLWSELDNHVKIPTCRCNGCTCKGCECNLPSKITQMFEAEKTYQFLLGLNDDLYSHIRGQILAIEPLPSLEKIFNIITQEEQHKRLMVRRDDRSESAVAYAVNHGDKHRGPSDRGICTHCGKYGRDESSCYEIVGYPPGWGNREKGRNRGRENCGGRVTSSRGRGAGRETACSVAESFGSGQQQAQSVNREEQSNNVVPGFTNDQVQHLLSLIEPSNSSYKKLQGMSP